MAPIEIQLSRKMIDWIANAEGTTPHALAERMMPKKTANFLSGKVPKGVAEKLARLGKIPFGYLFLNEPPAEEKIPVPDLRQAPDAVKLSRDLFDTYKDIRYKLDWYKDYLQEFGLDTRKDFIGRFCVSDPVEEVARDIATTLGFDTEKLRPTVSKDSYFSAASKLAENAGILVFKNGVVGANTHRPLNTGEFRGFCILDPVVPAVFINGADAFSAQTFTLFHEIAHIWTGQEGVSDQNFASRTEAFCNKVAAEILMPTGSFLSKWREGVDDALDPVTANARVSGYFKVSAYATAVKAKSLDLIDHETFLLLKSLSRKPREAGGKGGDTYASCPLRNSPRITDAILSAAVTQSLPLREAANMLNVKTKTVMELYNRRKGK